MHEAPSQRFRFEQYFQSLKENGFVFKTQPFLSLSGWKSFFRNGSAIGKATALISGFVKRTIILFQVNGYDFVFIHREAAPIGPPIFEWIIAKVFKKKIIYDFDDAIWMTDNLNENFLERLIRWRKKVSSICRWSYKVSCGNDYLYGYAKQFNSNVVLNPTTIDTKVHSSQTTDHSHRLSTMDNRLIIGWTGSRSTLKYLKTIEKELQQIENKYPNVEFHVIADASSDLKLKNVVFKPWSVETEISDLAQFDIGIMPLPDDEWSKGKCGFKILQYMALSIPSVASPVGVNSKIINNNINGFLAEGNQWEEFLSRLIEDATLRVQIGSEGQKTLNNYYSVKANEENFLSLFK